MPEKIPFAHYPIEFRVCVVFAETLPDLCRQDRRSIYVFSFTCAHISIDWCPHRATAYFELSRIAEFGVCVRVQSNQMHLASVHVAAQQRNLCTYVCVCVSVRISLRASAGVEHSAVVVWELVYLPVNVCLECMLYISTTTR